MIEIRKITAENKADINLKNDPFRLIGRLIVERRDGEWSYREEMLPETEVSEMVFPDENYVYEEMPDYVFLGAYDNSSEGTGDDCVGVAILCPHFTGRLYLEDLKVSLGARGKGVGKLLIKACKTYAKAQGYKGICTVGQDNNLIACRLYLSTGFKIGGLDTEIYEGTKQAGKADVYFYSE
ncbi:MAG: GNAT family N-acetyltransferase [Oscillospiraceae bacterium]|nr:GNAT family N-acetyltransferase [Oscillospiraceae bacterium]